MRAGRGGHDRQALPSPFPDAGRVAAKMTIKRSLLLFLDTIRPRCGGRRMTEPVRLFLFERGRTGDRPPGAGLPIRAFYFPAYRGRICFANMSIV
jgi:hypothetical protein